jgi:hypothetical protein
MVFLISALLVSVLSHRLEIGIATGGNRGKRAMMDLHSLMLH